VNRQAEIGATVTDDGGALTGACFALYVDGTEVSGFTYDPVTGRLRYTPPKRLAFATHTVRLLATDGAGNTASRTWSFTVRR